MFKQSHESAANGTRTRMDQVPIMSHEDVYPLISCGESGMLEFKATTGTRRKVARTVCAFANQNVGQMLFGVAETGTVMGQQVSDHLLKE